VEKYSIVPLRGDVTSQDSLKSISAIVKSEVGHINLLIANAGITGPGLSNLKPRHTLSDFVEHCWKSPINSFTEVYNLNCSATFYTIIAFLELLDAGNIKRDEGKEGVFNIKSQVIVTASSASFLRHPRAGFAYTSSKAALVSMMKSFSTFCIPWGIRFNALAAGCRCLYIYPLFFSFLFSRLKLTLT